MEYVKKYGITDNQWRNPTKLSYVFNKQWLDAFKEVDPRLTPPVESPVNILEDEAPTEMGIVFLHQPDGKTIIPVGVVARYGDENIFCYHPDYLKDAETKPIARTLPKSTLLHTNTDPKALLPFFDNLVSEGWLGHAQHNAYKSHHKEKTVDEDNFGKVDNGEERFKRLVTFGTGFHGAVSVVDVTVTDLQLHKEDQQVQQALASRSTLTGAQPKMLAVEDRGKNVFRPARRHETSTHIIKIGQSQYKNIVQNEYLNMVATRALIPDDPVNKATLSIMQITGVPVLVLDRFDRTAEGGRLHFEEALSLIGESARHKYLPSYKKLGELTRELAGEKEVKRLFKRILAHWVLGNTDGHWKNFAFWEKDGKFELTPNYDLVSADEYFDRINSGNKSLPMKISDDPREVVKDIDEVIPKFIFTLGRALKLPDATIYSLTKEMKDHVPAAIEAIKSVNNPLVTEDYKERFAENLEHRANRQYGTLERYWRHIASRDTGKRGLS